MTREALNKLNKTQMDYCLILSSLISQSKENNNQNCYERYMGELQGYLECLYDIGILNHMETKGLYLYFFSENRNKR